MNASWTGKFKEWIILLMPHYSRASKFSLYNTFFSFNISFIIEIIFLAVIPLPWLSGHKVYFNNHVVHKIVIM